MMTEEQTGERIAKLEASLAFVRDEIADIKKNVTNDMPHQIASIGEKLEVKFDLVMETMQKQINTHSEYDKETYARKDTSWAERTITIVATAFGLGIIAAIVTFIVRGGLQ